MTEAPIFGNWKKKRENETLGWDVSCSRYEEVRWRTWSWNVFGGHSLQTAITSGPSATVSHRVPAHIYIRLDFNTVYNFLCSAKANLVGISHILDHWILLEELSRQRLQIECTSSKTEYMAAMSKCILTLRFSVNRNFKTPWFTHLVKILFCLQGKSTYWYRFTSILSWFILKCSSTAC